MAAPVTIEFLGHASLLLEVDGARLLTDPALRSRIGPLRRTSAEPSVEGVDAVLVSHLHWDHLDLPSLRRLDPDVPVVVPRGAGDWLRGHGFGRVSEASVGDVVDLQGLRVEAVPAAHGGFRPPAGPAAAALGYVVRGRRSVYFAGDTALYPGMAELEGIELALLPVGGWGPTLRARDHLGPASAAVAAGLVGSAVAMPIHWGTYWPAGLGRIGRDRLTEPPRQFVRHAAELAPRVRVLPAEVGERVAIP